MSKTQLAEVLKEGYTSMHSIAYIKHCAALILVLLLAVGLSLTMTQPSEAGSRGKGILKGIIAGAVVYGAYRAIKKQQRGSRRARRSKHRNAKSSGANHSQSGKSVPRSRNAVITNDTRSMLREAQKSLADLGLYTKDIDGRYGPGTRTAIRQFQEEFGYERTGRLTSAQHAQLIKMTSRRTDVPVRYARDPDLSTTPAAARNASSADRSGSESDLPTLVAPDSTPGLLSHSRIARRSETDTGIVSDRGSTRASTELTSARLNSASNQNEAQRLPTLAAPD